MPTDEPTGTPEERRDRAADNPWVAPSPRPDGAGVTADGTPTSSEPLPVVAPPPADAPARDATPTAAYPPPSGSPTAAYPPPGSEPPTAEYPPPSGSPTGAYPPADTPTAAYPPPGSQPPSGSPTGAYPPPAAPHPAPPLPYGPPPAGIPPAGDVPPEGPGAKRGNPVGLVAFILGVLALVLAVLPIVSFFAGLPALAAIVLGIVGLVLAGRSRGFAAAGLIIGAVALVVAIAFSAVQAVTFVRDRVTDLPQISDFPSDFPSDLPSGDSSSGAGLAAGPHTVVYRVTGSGTASITYSTIADGRSATARDTQVTLPRVRMQHLTVTGGGSQQFVLAAITLDGKAKLGCSIEVDGTVIAHSTSNASSGVELVTCAGREGGF